MNAVIKMLMVLLLPFFVCQSSVKAQYSDSTTHYASLASTGSLNSTNSSRAYLFSNVMKLGVKKKKYSFNGFGSYIYGKQDSMKTNNDVIATVDVNWFPTKSKLYYWALLNYTSSYSLKINAQGQGGIGAAYNFIDDKNGFLGISDGILYEQGDLFVDTLHDVYNTFRNSLRLSFRYIYKDVITLSGINYVQTSLSSGKDYILKSNLALGFRIRKWLSFTTALNYTNFHRTNRENLLFTYGIVAEKYF